MVSSRVRLFFSRDPFRSCWDPEIDMDLFDHRVTLNLLYIQTVSDVERGWIQASAETKKQLASMQARGAKREVKTV